jgi:hypothetical protein
MVGKQNIHSSGGSQAVPHSSVGKGGAERKVELWEVN